MSRLFASRRRQSGFAYIAAVVFLVVVAGISVALLRLTDTQQTTVNQALLAARANLAARAGIEWVLHSPAQRCIAGQPTDLGDFRSDSGFLVTVGCRVQTYNEGEVLVGGVLLERQISIYHIDAVACNGAAGRCPDENSASVARPDYVERARSATICMTGNDAPCI